MGREPSLSELADIVLSSLREEARLLCDDERLTRGHAGYANDPGTVAKEANAFKESVAVVLDTAYRVKRLKPASNTVCCPTTLAVSASKRNP
ncbi:hypothetical protein KXD40_002313 [Peronospora effusa]|nr:hypothetical protein KXD40_002313 [Peronospora effusa]